MVTGVLFFYLWITLLHCLFVGVAVHVFLGHRRCSPAVLRLLCAALLAGIETYWIPIVRSAGASLTVSEPALLRAFDLTPQTNIIPLLGPGRWSLLLWLAQGALAYVMGRAAWTRARRRQTTGEGQK